MVQVVIVLECDVIECWGTITHGLLMDNFDIHAILTNRELSFYDSLSSIHDRFPNTIHSFCTIIYSVTKALKLRKHVTR